MSINQPRLTIKQKKFVEGIARGKSGTQAALEAYDTKDYKTASVISTENLDKPSIRQALEPILEKHDISLDSAIAPIGKGLKASKWNDFTGEREDDVKTQLSASDRALKLLGVKTDEPQGNTFIYVAGAQKEKYGI